MRAAHQAFLRFLGLALAGLSPPLGGAAFAEPAASLNLSGAPGVIEMPGGLALEREMLGLTVSTFGPIGRSVIGFQAAPWLSGSLRTTTVRHWNDAFCPPDCAGLNALASYSSRALDLRFHLAKEGPLLPALTVGLMGVMGPSGQAAEYIAATKSLGDRLTLTAGLGWGRLATHGALGAPFGPRPADNGDGLSLDQMFQGDVAPFAGVELRLTDRWAVKAEYSSDGYVEEAGLRGTFDRASPVNFGVEYRQSDMLRFGAYSLYGSQIGVAAQVILDPGHRPGGGIGGSGPTPVMPRPPIAQDPEAWSPEWVSQPGVHGILIQNLTRFLERSGIRIEALSFTGDLAQVRIRVDRLDAEAQAVGRVARAMTHLMPASVELFEIVPVVAGVPVSMVRLSRSDVEALEFAPDGAARIRARAEILDAGAPSPDLARNPDLYPDFRWSLAPYADLSLMDPGGPVTGDIGLRASARYSLAPGLEVQATASKIGLFLPGTDAPGGAPGLPPVRSDEDLYRQNGDPAIETLTAAWQGRLGTDLFGRLTLGYLEPMFAGLSAEALWWPAGQVWALGAEANLVAQRDTNGGLGLDDYGYQVASGHLSGYLNLGSGYQAQLDLGRYLAGDLGGTLTLTRRFETGWTLAAQGTLTGATETAQLGIGIEVPTSWFTGQPVRSARAVSIRPALSDAGARLQVNGRLHDQLIDYTQTGLDEQWARFWK